MPTRSLDNYLRMHRLRAGLSQDSLAHLLGTRSGTRVSRYERGTRLPSLDIALALEAIFGVSVQTLFRGRYEWMAAAVKIRRRSAIRRTSQKTPNAA